MNDPKQFLKNEFQKRKDRNPNYSLRAFAKWLQVSPAQLSLMFAGKRSITINTLNKITDRLGVSPASKQELFRGLINQKNGINAPPEINPTVLAEEKFRVIADWYHLAILSLTKVKGASSDPRWIARRLGIKVEEAHQAVQRLEFLGILQTRPMFKQVMEPFDVVSEIPSAAIRKYHKQHLNLAIERIETVDIKLRQFQSVAIPMNASQVKQIKSEIDDFLNRIADICDYRSATEVYSLNVQLFPLTSSPKGDKDV